MGTQHPSSKRGRSPPSPPKKNRPKTTLGMEVGISPGDFVLDGDPAPVPKKRVEPPIFGPCLLRPKGCMDQDATWYGGRPRPRRHCVTWRPSSPLKRVTAPQFFVHVCCGETAGWIKMPLGREVGLGPRDIMLDGDPDALPEKGAQQPPTFWPMSVVAKRLDGSSCHLVRR